MIASYPLCKVGSELLDGNLILSLGDHIENEMWVEIFAFG